jgi:hypothetical protein
MCAVNFAWCVSVILLCTVFFVVLFVERGDDDVILRSKLVESSRILLVNQKLFFKFELELILFVGLYVNIGFTSYNKRYYSSLLSKWLEIFVIGIYLLQLSQDPTNLIPSIKKFVVILIYPSLPIGKNFFFG